MQPLLQSTPVLGVRNYSKRSRGSAPDSPGPVLFFRVLLSGVPLSDFRKVVEEYVADEELFFKEFAEAFAKLISLGTPAPPAGDAGIAGFFQSILAMLGLGSK